MHISIAFHLIVFDFVYLWSLFREYTDQYTKK